MFLQLPDIEEYIPFIIVAALIAGGVILLKIGLTVIRSQERIDMKWVLISFFIQFVIVLFISAPLALDKVIAIVHNIKYEGPQTPTAVIVIIISLFIVVNIINVIHKRGITLSIVLTLFVMGPIGSSVYLLFSSI